MLMIQAKLQTLPHPRLALWDLLNWWWNFAPSVQWNTVKKQAIAYVETEFPLGAGQRPQNEVPKET